MLAINEKINIGKQLDNQLCRSSHTKISTADLTADVTKEMKIPAAEIASDSAEGCETTRHLLSAGIVLSFRI